MASNYSQNQYYGEYLRYVESLTRLYNEVPPSFQNYLAYQKQEAMAVKEYQQKETNPSTSAAEKRVFQSDTKRERCSAKQTDTLVKLWKENFFLLETPKCPTVWQKVKAEVNKHGPEKTITQCKNKIRDLQAAYKGAKENNNKSGVSLEFCQYFNDFNEVLVTRDVINLRHISEVGVERERR